jgi:cytochrome c oxidase cbb3-type subunit III
MAKKETNRLLGHADDNDGIDEYDNPLPDWWIGLFWLTIVWAVGYTVHYHFIAQHSQEKELAAEMAAALVRWPASDSPISFVVTPELAAQGEEVYAGSCVGCHGVDGQGGIGPSLRDGEWIHGGSPEEILRSISDGIPARGMPGWGPILGAEKTRQVTAYVAGLSELRSEN